MKSCRFLVLSLMFVLISAFLNPLQAGKSAAKKVVSIQPVTATDEHAHNLLKQINRAALKSDRILAALKTVGKEDRLVLELQVSKLWVDSEHTLLQLADALLDLEKDRPQPDLRPRVEAVFRKVSPNLRSEIERFRQLINTTRELRHEAPAEKRYALELKVVRYTAHLDEFFLMNFRHIEKMTELGMETKNDRGVLGRILSDRVDELFGRISLSLLRIEDLKIRLKDIPDDTEASRFLVVAQKSLSSNAASMVNSLDLMDNLQIDTALYRSQLATGTHDFSSSLFNVDVVTRLAGRAFNTIIERIVEYGPTIFIKLFIFCTIICIFRFAKRLLRTGLKKVLGKSDLKLSQLAQQMIVTWASRLVMIFGVILALAQFNISLGPLLAGLGVAGFVVGFALQDTLSNFASGMMILVYRPYDIGDLVDAGGVFGVVNKMSLVSTTLLTLDNQTIVIPNSKIWGDVIKNVTAQKNRRVDMVFGIAYSDDIPKAEALLEEILQTNDKVLKNPEPIVRLHTLGASSVDFVVRPWALVEDYWDVYWDVTRTVKLKFDEKGISIPFPQRDVHIYNENALVTPID